MTCQSALYLSGNKRSLLPNIEPHTRGKKVLVDVFTGSGTIPLNLSEGRERVIANDNSEHYINLHKSLQSTDWILQCYEENKGYKDSREDFDRLKADYNKDLLRLDLLYLIMMRSHSNSIRFNSKGGCNITHGKRERFDIKRMFTHQQRTKDVEWYNLSFVAFLSRLEELLEVSGHTLEDTVIYLDPPYQSTTTHYTGQWDTREDEILLKFMVDFHNKGAKIVYSNVFYNRGVTSQWLIDWCEEHSDKFEVIHLDRDYNNCSSFKYEGVKSDEVLIVSK